MPRLRYIKGNLRRGDFLRGLLTDTSPYELPLIVSNDGFYKNVTDLGLYSEHNRAIIEKIITGNSEKYTIPYRYTVTKDSVSVRRLSLIHPSSQFAMVNFYRKYDSLICYFSSLGPISIRHPRKVGSSFFFATSFSDENKYKNNRVDTTDVDKFVRNPASYFAYSGYDRLYKFYTSSSFMRLERKYPVMTLMDISKCFDSIYSHCVSWAIKNAENSKENTSASSFGNDFDKLMQQSNYNETNGICIGPECSRIFAEIILQRVDLEILREASSDGLRFGKDFDCKRYVDDYMLFCKSPDIEKRIIPIIQHCLAQFNLHLNEQKFRKFERPFLTPKSHIVQATKTRLTVLFETIFDLVGQNLLIPKRIYKPSAFVRSFIASIKSVCFEEEASYDMVSNYVIASLAKRIDRITRDYEQAKIENDEIIHNYRNVLLTLMELIFFFYTVNPTVASSFNVSRAIIITSRFSSDHLPSDSKMIAGQIQDWINQFVLNSSALKRSSPRSKIPVEVLNVLIASGELGTRNSVTESWLLEHALDVDHLEYFSIVSCLYYIKDKSGFSNLRLALELRISKALKGCSDIRRSAHDAHLALDVLSCPYLTDHLRRETLSNLRRHLSLPTRTPAELDQDLTEFTAAPWFVGWNSLDIVNMIRKKELSAVY